VPLGETVSLEFETAQRIPCYFDKCRSRSILIRMPLYFLLLDARSFHERLVPPLAAAWRQRSFQPCRPLADWLQPACAALRDGFFGAGNEPLLAALARGLPFDRNTWRMLAGEALLVAATEMPEIQTAPAVLRCLLAPETLENSQRLRVGFTPIEQVHFGARDLTFGGAVYRPDHAGYNDSTDVCRLTDYLNAIDPARWQVDALAELAEEERQEELDFAREWFGPLRDMYRCAAEQNQVIVCELL
jgi:hypothetical protein